MEERLGLVFAARVVVEGGKMAKEATVSDHNETPCIERMFVCLDGKLTF